ncbi:MAG: beta-propeller fold lactonase family protein, partial [Cyclobacteriaceae bacterium]|nr:beta-propeller fold lactonase family protein [Cyclobacteriaceae bacterium]
MSKPVRWIIFLGMPLVTLWTVVYLGYQWGLEHAQFMTGGTPHPVNCFSCHLYLDQDNQTAKLLEKPYISPFKIKVSPDGRSLYVTGHESNEFLIVDLETGKVKSKIPVGIWPHSIALTKDGSTAFVSNHWSENISVIDLDMEKVIDTLQVGTGPAGL